MGEKEGERGVAKEVDVEEGEISDSCSVEEISEKDFTKGDVAAAAAEEKKKIDKELGATTTSATNSSSSRVWTMQDLYKYQNNYHHQTSSNYKISNAYASGLYNLAWAQAVNNKPLDHYLIPNFRNNDNSNINPIDDDDNVSNNNNAADPNTLTLNNPVVIQVDDDDDDETAGITMEQGELEEGEIDLDSEPQPHTAFNNNQSLIANNSHHLELEKQLNLISQELHTLSLNDGDKSYDGVCSRLHNFLDSLRNFPRDYSVSQKDALIHKAFASIQTVKHMFFSMSQNLKEQNKDVLSRLFAHITSQNPPLFSSEQMTEIEAVVPFLGSVVMSSSVGDTVMGEEIQCDTIKSVEHNESNVSAHNASDNSISLKKCVLESMSVNSPDQNNSYTLDMLKTGVASFKGRGAMLPLLDLHKDHDADSLPSPTRETQPLFSLGKALSYGNGEVRPEWPVPRPAADTQIPLVQSYGTDTLKAFSTYQQKFGRNTYNVTNRLPSPTPSEESDNGDGDTGEEISSSSTLPNVVNAPTLSQTIVSSIPQTDNSSGQGLMNTSSTIPLHCLTRSAVRTSVKSRDPRLRLANLNATSMDLNPHKLPFPNTGSIVVPREEVTNSRKQKIVQEPDLYGPALKRQKNELSESISGYGGWLEDRGTAGLHVTGTDCLLNDKGSQPRNFENALVPSGNGSSILCGTSMEPQHSSVIGGNTTASLNSLLKDIAVNPTLWMNIFKMKQQKNVDPAKVTSQPLGSDYVLGSLPSINNVLSINPAPEQRSAGALQALQKASSDEVGKLRMKPRDPRRVLQNNISHKAGNLESGQAKSKKVTTQVIVNQTVQKQDQLKSVSTHSTEAPDIARLFTKNLKNIANIMYVSQTSTFPPVHSSSVNSNGVLPEASHLTGESDVPSEAVTAAPSQSQNKWREVEHLFQGFDDKQKADIQKERARRLEEQNKMFAARKLCLVLDLDHTLLNSAKFSEIDPIHEELLRKKEEEDRQKPHRHLFRFPHMGMWTKLRPGVWNFLEKASRLFEMHLYTMGNKLYATEMAKVLDPKGVLFAGRVISKGDDGDISDGDDRVHKTKDLEGVLGMESSVVIIDDSIRVWPHHKLNLIAVERYIYFPCSRRQFGLSRNSLLEVDHDERPESGSLASSLGVIERIHQNFFSSKSLDEADVRNILAAEQRKILDGCHILFSRVIPLGEANPHMHPLWQMAEQFGAVCTTQMDEHVTHVVANLMGTDKVTWAFNTGKFVVHPDWLEASTLLYRRANEHDFAIKP